MTDFKQRTETYRQEERAHLKGAFHCRKEGAWASLLKPLIRGRTTASRTSKATLLTYPAQRQPSRSAAGTENERDEGDPSPVTAKGLKQPPSAGGQRRSPASFFPPSSFPRGPGGARPSAAGPGVPGGQPRFPRSAPRFLPVAGEATGRREPNLPREHAWGAEGRGRQRLGVVAWRPGCEG